MKPCIPLPENFHGGPGEGVARRVTMETKTGVPRLHAGPAPRVLQDRASFCARHGEKGTRIVRVGRLPLPVNIITRGKLSHTREIRCLLGDPAVPHAPGDSILSCPELLDGLHVFAARMGLMNI